MEKNNKDTKIDTNIDNNTISFKVAFCKTISLAILAIIISVGIYYILTTLKEFNMFYTI
ncbi:MAG: hypothetical protein ACTTGJ_03145 [Clostridium sp.]